MKPPLRWALAALAAGAAAWLLWTPVAPPAPPVTPRTTAAAPPTTGDRPPFRDPRLVALRSLTPRWSRERVEASARATDALPPERRDAVRERLAELELSEPEVRAFFEANRAAFGDREFPASRSNAETLLKVHRVRQEFGFPDPENGLTYPD